MDAQLLSIAAFVISVGAALFAIRRQSGTAADSRVRELEEEVKRLTNKVSAQELQIDNLLAQLHEQRALIRRMSDEIEAKDAANDRLMKRLTGD